MLFCDCHRGGYEVVFYRKMREEIEVLENHSHPSQNPPLLLFRDIYTVADKVGAFENDGSAVDTFKPDNRAKHGAFAGAGGADDRDHFSPADAKRNIAENFVVAEGFAHMLDYHHIGGYAVIHKNTSSEPEFLFELIEKQRQPGGHNKVENRCDGIRQNALSAVYKRF